MIIVIIDEMCFGSNFSEHYLLFVIAEYTNTMSSLLPRLPQLFNVNLYTEK